MFSSGSQRVLTEGRRGPAQEPCALRAVPGLTGRRVALPRGQPGDAPSPSRRQTPLPLGFLEPARHSTAVFPALKAGSRAAPPLQENICSGTWHRRRGNKRHRGAGRALLCLRLRSASSAAGLGIPPHAPPAAARSSVLRFGTRLSVGSANIYGADSAPGTELGPGRCW